MSSANSRSAKLFWPHSILKLASSIALFITNDKYEYENRKENDEHGSCMYAAFLNASRAFDVVNSTKLCSKLLKRDVPKWIIKVIAQWYCNQSVCVRWGSAFSDLFLRQVDILLPIAVQLKTSSVCRFQSYL